MADSKSAEMENLSDKEIYHKQARAGNRIKTTMASIKMEIDGLDQRRKELERRYGHLEEALELLQFAPLNIGKRDLPERTPSNHLGLCNEIPMPGGSGDKPVEMKFCAESYSEFMGKDLLMKDWPESSVNRPIEITGMLPTFTLGSRDKFYPNTMKGRDWFDMLNVGCSFPESTEGYWRQSAARPPAEQFEKLPWPVAVEIRRFDPVDFVQRLKELEAHSGTEKKVYRGCTTHRWTGDSLGNSEYWRGPFRWPNSYSVYLTEGVPPSKYFYRFVMLEHEEAFPNSASTMSTSEFDLVFSLLPTYQSY